MLAEAIASVLSQEDVELEVVVADSAPEPTAGPVVEAAGDSRGRFLHVPASRGMVSVVRNAGAAQARFPLVHFLDDDDLLEPRALSTLARALLGNPALALAFGRLSPFGPDPALVAKETRYFEPAATPGRLSGPRWP